MIDVTISGAKDGPDDDYDDAIYLEARDALIRAVGEVWDAGAPTDDIAEAVQTGLADAGADANPRPYRSGGPKK